MRALILGAGGQVGRALAAALPGAAALDQAACDIADETQVRRAVAETRPDLVFNAAAFVAVDKAESEPEAAARINARAPGLIAAAAREAGARTVHISTDFVFGGAAEGPRKPDEPTSPESVYGRTKAAGERALLAADPDGLVVRTAWVYGPGGRNFVTTMLNVMRERSEVRVVDDQFGTPTWAPSLASALVGLAEAGASGIHHFTDAGVASWYDFAVAIAEEARPLGLIERDVRVVPIATGDYPTPAKRPAFSVLDKGGTWALLGGPPSHWRENLRRNLRELASNG